jgi:hypothetical protein
VECLLLKTLTDRCSDTYTLGRYNQEPHTCAVKRSITAGFDSVDTHTFQCSAFCEFLVYAVTHLAVTINNRTPLCRVFVGTDMYIVHAENICPSPVRSGGNGRASQRSSRHASTPHHRSSCVGMALHRKHTPARRPPQSSLPGALLATSPDAGEPSTGSMLEYRAFSCMHVNVRFPRCTLRHAQFAFLYC